MREFEFRPVTRNDLPQFLEWLKRPHVSEWWGKSPDSVEDLTKEYEEAISGSDRHKIYFAYLGGVAVAFIQSYTAVAFHSEGWWLSENDSGVRGIDQFIADESLLDQGIGTGMIMAFVSKLFDDPAVTRVQTDPDAANARAIRCYEKAGFHPTAIVDTPAGRGLLMYCDRTA